MTIADLALQRLRSQRLVDPPLGSVEAVVGWLGAVQSQDYAGATWALAQRTAGVRRADIDALFDAGAVLRTHVLRPTWHFVLPGDLRWMLALSRDRVVAAMAPYDRKLELDAAVVARSNDLLARALTGGQHRTRKELGDVLRRGGIEASGQRLAHLMMRAELDAVVCSGPRRGAHFTYALLDERAAPAPALPREQALGALALRYVTSHGPATVRDFAWWAGLTMADARRGLDSVCSGLEQAVIDGAVYWFAAPASEAPLPAPLVHLLPNYDEHVVAYRDHGPSLDPGAPRALEGWGTALTSHLVVRNGLVAGGWRRVLERDRVVVTATRHAALDPVEDRALEAAARAFGAFLELPVALVDAPARHGA